MKSFVRLMLIAVVCVFHGSVVLAQGASGSDGSGTPSVSSNYDDVGGLRASPGQRLEIPFQESRVLKLDLTRDANDIWDRIRRGFGMPDLDSDLVVERQLFYLNRPAFLRTVFERGGQYLYYIVDEIERRGLPTELALLPMVESNYNPLALSRAKASGLWQFIPSTGRNFNLTQNQWVDERRDVIASTNAALDYLEYLYEFHGDWHLALASYNWGEGSVARAIKKNLDQNLPTEYRDLAMPDETRQYIPKLQALKNIVSNPELFNFELPHVANDEHFTTVPAPRGIDLATAARLAEMSMDEFVALNPGYNRPIINSDDDVLVVPADRAEQFKLRLSQHASSSKRWVNYQLRKGDTLASIARKYGMSINQLREINGLDARASVRVGQSLLVPAKP
ncbi:MAG TPA: transglycosylase SLT domain-containing protein [Rhodocyclaceae bacterium]|nr:transglycosylase SLT domain-containing protein [Rhodocyclaceae bacterium]